jgi:hypothetical protein
MPKSAFPRAPTRPLAVKASVRLQAALTDYARIGIIR